MTAALIARALHSRQAHEAVFAAGGYEPLDVVGKRADHILAFIRTSGADAIMVAGVLNCAKAVLGSEQITPPSDYWGDTAILVPKAYTGRSLEADGALPSRIEAATLFRHLPAVVLNVEAFG